MPFPSVPKAVKFAVKPLIRYKQKKKSRSVSRSDPSSFSSGSSASSSFSDLKEGTTPKSVIPTWSPFEPRLDEAAEVFKLFDRDGDGKISKRELELLFRQLGAEPQTEEELGVIFAEADRDGDGCISLEEFRELTSELGPAGGPELRYAFEHFDRNGDGKISAEELFGFFESIGEEGCTLDDCRRMIVGVDTDGDGFVCYEDFARMMVAAR